MPDIRRKSRKRHGKKIIVLSVSDMSTIWTVLKVYFSSLIFINLFEQVRHDPSKGNIMGVYVIHPSHKPAVPTDTTVMFKYLDKFTVRATTSTGATQPNVIFGQLYYSFKRRWQRQNRLYLPNIYCKGQWRKWHGLQFFMFEPVLWLALSGPGWIIKLRCKCMAQQWTSANSRASRHTKWEVFFLKIQCCFLKLKPQNKKKLFATMKALPLLWNQSSADMRGSKNCTLHQDTRKGNTLKWAPLK